MSTAARASSTRLLTIANGLTAVRLLLVPVFAALVLVSGLTEPGWRIAACAAFVVAALTDYWDGRIARARDEVTAFGAVADPIADKALTGTAFVLLSWFDAVPWWVTVLVLAREVGVTAIRFWVIRLGVIPASRGGKLKTALQLVAIPWYLLPWPDPLDRVGPWILAAAVVVTVVTGFDYVIRAVALRRAASRTAASGTAASSTAASSTASSSTAAQRRAVPDAPR